MNGGMKTGVGRHHSARMLEETWLTPPWILDALGPFDLDPCAAPDPRPWPTAAPHIARPADGLAAPWHGRVWLNPPYSSKAAHWLAKLADHGTGTALIFARTETSWFRELVWGRADLLLFVHGRLTFHRADGTPGSGNGGAPSVLVGYGATDAGRLAECGVPGSLVTAWRRSGSQVAQPSLLDLLTEEAA